MAQKPLSILISGAGVAGASLALLLARHPSFKVKPIITLIERSATPRSTGQAIDIRGQGVEVIRQLGLEPTIKARHTTEKGFALVDTHGGTVARFDATGDAKQQSITSEYEILRSELVDILLADLDEAKAAGANVNVIHGETISSIDDTDAGVTVTFKNNLPQQTFDAVLGADGSSSKTRKLMFGDTDYRRPSGMYIAFFTIPRIESDSDLYRLCMLPGGLSLHLRPHRGGKTMGAYLAISNGKKAPIPELDEVLAQDQASQKKYLQERFRGAGWQADRFVAALDGADDFYMTHWCQVVTQKWTKGRVAMLGDAAFATMGIGTSMAFMSAYVIAGELSKVVSSSEVPAALEKYETVFRPFAKTTERSFAGGSFLAPQSAFGVGVLQTIVRVVAMTRLHKLLMAIFGGDDQDGWKLPDYGFEEKVVSEK